MLAMMFEPVDFADRHGHLPGRGPGHEIFGSPAGEVEVAPARRARLVCFERGDVVGEYRHCLATGCVPPRWSRADRFRVAGARLPAFRRFLLAFPESALVLFKLTVDQLLAARAAEAQREA